MTYDCSAIDAVFGRLAKQLAADLAQWGAKPTPYRLLPDGRTVVVAPKRSTKRHGVLSQREDVGKRAGTRARKTSAASRSDTAKRHTAPRKPA